MKKVKIRIRKAGRPGVKKPGAFMPLPKPDFRPEENLPAPLYGPPKVKK